MKLKIEVRDEEDNVLESFQTVTSDDPAVSAAQVEDEMVDHYPPEFCYLAKLHHLYAPGPTEQGAAEYMIVITDETAKDAACMYGWRLGFAYVIVE